MATTAREDGLTAQRAHHSLVRIQVGCTVMAAVGLFLWSIAQASAYDHRDLAAVGLLVGLSGFGAALVTRLFISTRGLDREADQLGRLASIVESAPWRYSVAAAPFEPSGDAYADDQTFIDYLSALMATISLDQLGPALPSQQQISAAMRALPRSEFEKRKEAYLTSRLEAEREYLFYTSKVAHRRDFRLTSLSLVVEISAIVLLLAAGFLTESGEQAGIAAAQVLATFSAGLIGYQQLAGFSIRSKSAAGTTHRLALLQSSIGLLTDETRWSTFVEASETIIASPTSAAR